MDLKEVKEQSAVRICEIRGFLPLAKNRRFLYNCVYKVRLLYKIHNKYKV